MLLKVLKTPTIRLCMLSTIKEKLREEKSTDGNTFVPIYKFPYIRIFSVINKLKLYQTVITAAAVPSAGLLTATNIVAPDALLVTCGVGVSGTLIFYSLGYLTTRFVGFIYLSSDGNTLKISSVDFWGKRKDELISATDVVPFSDLPNSMIDGLYLKVRRFSSSDSFKLNTRFGVILDKDRFNKVFK